MESVFSSHERMIKEIFISQKSKSEQKKGPHQLKFEKLNAKKLSITNDQIILDNDYDVFYNNILLYKENNNSIVVFLIFILSRIFEKYSMNHIFKLKIEGNINLNKFEKKISYVNLAKSISLLIRFFFCF